MRVHVKKLAFMRVVFVKMALIILLMGSFTTFYGVVTRAQMVQTPSLIVAPGNEGGHGGIGVVKDKQIYLLDFVEAGIEKNTLQPLLLLDDGRPLCIRGFLVSCLDQVPINEGIQVGQLFRDGLIIREIQVKNGNSFEAVRFIDDARKSFFDRILSKSSWDNDYLFGNKLNISNCTNCYSEKTMFSVRLTNQFLHQGYMFPVSDRSEFLELGNSQLYEIFMSEFLKIEWILVEHDLTYHGDDLSPLLNKVVLAERKNNVVLLAKKYWEPGSLAGGVQPLDLSNRMGVVAHEVFYNFTEWQGDRNSLRARAMAGIFFSRRWKYLIDPGRPDSRTELYNLMERVPIKPVPSDKIEFVHELNANSYILVKKDINLGKGTCASLLYDVEKSKGVIFEDAYYPEEASPKHEAYSKLISTQREYINGKLCFGGYHLESITLKKGTRISGAGGYLQKFSLRRYSPENRFPFEQYFIVTFNVEMGSLGPTNRLVIRSAESGSVGVTEPSRPTRVEDFNKVYGDYFEIVK